MIVDIITFEDLVAFSLVFLIDLLLNFCAIRWVQNILHQFYRFR